MHRTPPDDQQHHTNQPAAAAVFATRRLDRGLQCSSVQWGPWASGLALSDPAILQRFERAGLGALPGGCRSKQGFGLNSGSHTPNCTGALPAHRRLCIIHAAAGQTGLAILQDAIVQARATACLVGASIHWAKLLQSLPQVPGILADIGPSDERTHQAHQSHLPASSKVHGAPPGTLALGQAAAPAVGTASQAAAVQASVLKQVTQVACDLLGTAPEIDRPLMEAGLDSLGKQAGGTAATIVVILFHRLCLLCCVFVTGTPSQAQLTHCYPDLHVSSPVQLRRCGGAAQPAVPALPAGPARHLHL